MSELFHIPHFQVFAGDAINVPFGVPVDINQRGVRILWGAIIPGIIQILLTVAFIISFLYLLWGGISWVTSGGNKESLEKARKKVTYAILGLVLVLLSFLFIFTLGDMFGVRFR